MTSDDRYALMSEGLSVHDQRKRELVLAQREAFKRGVNAQKMGRCVALTLQELDDAAKLRYPMPRMTRYRVFTHQGIEYRVKDNILEWRPHATGADWQQSTSKLDLYLGLKDLFAHPIEEVPDE